MAQELPEQAAVIAPDEVIELRLGEDGPAPVVTVPVGTEVAFRLTHVDGWAGDTWSGRGGPTGLVVLPAGTVTFTAAENQEGRSWDVDVKHQDGRASFVVQVVPASGAFAIDSTPSRVHTTRRSDAGPLVLAWGSVLGTWVGGTVGFAIGDASNGIDGQPPGVMTGGLLGSGVGLGTTALVMNLNPDAEYSHDQFALLTSTSTLGAWTGLEAARAFIPPGDGDAGRRIALAGALGSLAGTGLGLALTPNPPPSRVMWGTDLGALIGWQAAAGGSDMGGLTLPDDRQRRAGIALAGGVLGGAAIGTLRAAGVEGPDGTILTTSMLEGG